MQRSNDEDAVRRFGHLEEKARRYCELKGLDPDERIRHGSAEFSDRGPGFYTDQLIYTEQWLFVARHIQKVVNQKKDEALIMTELGPWDDG